jgi:ADP-ribose pyrophosphatase YjhB (NUDIX family)
MELRVSAGAIVIDAGRLLLVSYSDSPSGAYFVCPGGGVIGAERIDQAMIREVREETRLEVDPIKILFVEDLLSKQQRIVKVWFLCRIKSGRLTDTPEAREEGITGVGWYSKDELHDATVYPSALLSHDWNDFFARGWEAEYLKSTMAD